MLFDPFTDARADPFTPRQLAWRQYYGNRGVRGRRSRRRYARAALGMTAYGPRRLVAVRRRAKNTAYAVWHENYMRSSLAEWRETVNYYDERWAEYNAMIGAGLGMAY